MSWYYNAAGHKFAFPELPLEPPDCWNREEEPCEEDEEDEYK